MIFLKKQNPIGFVLGISEVMFKCRVPKVCPKQFSKKEFQKELLKKFLKKVSEEVSQEMPKEFSIYLTQKFQRDLPTIIAIKNSDGISKAKTDEIFNGIMEEI